MRTDLVKQSGTVVAGRQSHDLSTNVVVGILRFLSGRGSQGTTLHNVGTARLRASRSPSSQLAWRTHQTCQVTALRQVRDRLCPPLLPAVRQAHWVYQPSCDAAWYWAQGRPRSMRALSISAIRRPATLGWLRTTLKRSPMSDSRLKSARPMESCTYDPGCVGVARWAP